MYKLIKSQGLDFDNKENPQICYNNGETVCWGGGKLGHKNRSETLGTVEVSGVLGLSASQGHIKHADCEIPRIWQFSIVKVYLDTCCEVPTVILSHPAKTLQVQTLKGYRRKLL